MQLKQIAHIQSAFPSKFGIPRQSGIVPNLAASIIFEKEYRDPQALRGLEGFSHLWILWGFSEVKQTGWSPTVRPPKLGGNTRIGVFASRSPYRPNPIGLSAVRLERLELRTKNGPILHILGADMLDGTPIYDIKPYLPTDSYPEASFGFFRPPDSSGLRVHLDPDRFPFLSAEDASVICALLREDPRPAYHDEPLRQYGMQYKQYEIKFIVSGNEVTVTDIIL
jgi:tRNA-Thr(GGU) m(6)t(6)A37 methyltransferase TsaA